VVVKAGREEAYRVVLDMLGAHRIVVLHCDTIYGLIGISPETEPKIRSIKGRTEGKPFINLIPDVSWLPRLTDMELPQPFEKYWPGPLTLIFPARGGDTVGLRVPEDELLRRLMYDLDRPLFSTSVNRSGHPPLTEIRAIIAEFSDDVDLIVDSGDAAEGRPSTIIDLTRTPFKLVRRGAVLVSEVSAD
jgi:L-threonylcarbamoyladenylate synthase